MLLIAQELLAQIEKRNDLLGKHFGGLETFSKEQNFSNELIIGNRHSNGSEQLFQVIGKLGSTTITFTSRVHSNENTSILVDLDSLSKEG